MRNTFVVPLAAVVGFLGLAAVAFGKEPSGQDLYKANCKVCHAAGSPHGEYTPMTLIQDQWERFFKEKYEAKHKGLTLPGPEGKPVLDVITPDMLAKIKQFAVDHAADSEHPMTCGN